MPQNVEIKAVATDFTHQYKIAEKIADTAPEILIQKDTFFNVPSGRLKLREFETGNGELIFYKRPDRKSASRSTYQIFRTNDPEELKKTLVMALGIVGVVTKTRHVFLLGQTRIHFDKVEDLGYFIEFEYVLGRGEDPAAGEKLIGSLLQELNIFQKDLISHAYIDLLLSK